MIANGVYAIKNIAILGNSQFLIFIIVLFGSDNNIIIQVWYSTMVLMVVEKMEN